MRPLRLDLHGFTVFREPTTVDFTDADFFALVGPTGAGKSTVLDAICFALYGTVPRWGDRRRIENALAPSSNEARVRLIFEAAGARFAATRVVRRDGKGKVSTSHAGLEQLPTGFDLASFDAAPAQRGDSGLGQVLAGTPAEMDAAVIDAVGLPYEQFTSCVILPQGEFARFLHAKPAERQEILVNLLGLHVYQRIGERAGLVARDAEARAAATRSLLGDLVDADEAALAAAHAAVAAGGALVADVEELLPALVEAGVAGDAARVELSQVDGQLRVLAAVRTPAGVSRLGEELDAAQDEATAADAAVVAAEEREEKVRAELVAAGDKTALSKLADAYAGRNRLAERVASLAAGVAAATKEHATAGRALAAAEAKAKTATEALAQAQQAIEAAQTADRAGTLRVHLVAGEPCPVCEQPVATVPEQAAPALATARKRHAQAEQTVAAATAAASGLDARLRDLDRALAAAAAQHAESTRQLSDLDATLAEAPPLVTVEAQQQAIAAAERAVSAAGEEVRSARARGKAAATRHRGAADAVRSAWRSFDQTRDGLATLGPPAVDRDDLVGSWQAVQQWAASTLAERQRARDTVLAVAEAALTAITDLVGRLDDRFAAAGLPPAAPAGVPASYQSAAAVAVERAEAALDRVQRQRAQAAKLTDQVAGYDQEARVAKSLAQHLRADRFERWLLAEALDALVSGASRILRELTSGQYDLGHDKGEFYVVDHTDAGLRRGVRTLSGGETFQTSLALALALSEQLAGLSTAAASLESIMLDEGFGTLDISTLDTVAATLENLAAQGDRMVGVVTHVPALAERIPVRFEVQRDGRGGATVVRTG